MISQTHWILFNLAILLFLAFDLGIFNRNNAIPSYKRALGWTIFWITISLIFGIWIYIHLGLVAFFEFITSYKIEKILSLDNVIVFTIIFESLKIPRQHQHRVLFVGIISALFLRGLMIFLGIELLAKFSWILKIFGIFLIFTGLKFFKQNKETSLSDSKFWTFCQKIIPLSSKLQGNCFFITDKKKRKATPLLFALIMIEFSDIIFALDSLPAIFSITTNSFIIYTSNVLAILGLRSLYFVLVDTIEKLKYLKTALGFTLVLIGVKLSFDIHFHPAISLSVLTCIFSTAIIFSMHSKR